MANPLQDCRAAVDWAASGQVIEIAEKIAEFKRLSSIIEADLAALDADRVPTGWRDTAVRGRLEFGFADERQEVPEVRCRLTANVDAVCQRCLQAFKLRLATEMNMLLLVFGQNVEGYEDYEVWELEDRTLRPIDVVEELLVMALPLSAMHADAASCKALPQVQRHEQETTRPFAALRKQMNED